MPRIKRWFPVSHDINRDPEMWELCAKFGDKALRCWLEILSIADRNEGELQGSLNSISTAVAWAIRCKSAKTLRILNGMMTINWLHVDGCIKVTNWAKYHKTWEPKKLLDGSLPSYPNLPNLPYKNKNKNKKPLSVAPIVLPDWLPQKEWDEFKAHRKRKRAPLTDSIAGRLIQVLRQLKNLGHDPAQVLTEAVDRNWTGIKIDWIDKPGGLNGKDQRQPAEPKGFAGLRDFLKAHNER